VRDVHILARELSVANSSRQRVGLVSVRVVPRATLMPRLLLLLADSSAASACIHLTRGRASGVACDLFV